MRRRRNRNRDEPSSFGIVLGKLSKVLLALCIAVAVLEAVGTLVMGEVRKSRPATAPELSDQDIARLYDTEQPETYRAILAEGARLAATYEPLVEYRLPASSGRYFTVTADGYRGNGAAQNLSAPGAKVFVFGGSTTFGMGVADNETIPAQLEAVLRDAGKDAQVFNFGVLSWFSTQERIALERMLTAGVKPDVAVFIDGLSDFQACEFPDRSAWSQRIAQATRTAARQPLAAELARRSDALAMGRWLTGESPAEAPDHSIACASDADVDRVIRRLDTNRRIIAGMADRLGFKAVFVQQPVPTFHYDNTKRPVPVNTELLGHHLNSAKGYPRMVEMRGAGLLLDQGVLWLAEMEPTEGNAYVDTAHYSPRFNRVLAEAIGRNILDNALLP